MKEDPRAQGRSFVPAPLKFRFDGVPWIPH